LKKDEKVQKTGKKMQFLTKKLQNAEKYFL